MSTLTQHEHYDLDHIHDSTNLKYETGWTVKRVLEQLADEFFPIEACTCGTTTIEQIEEFAMEDDLTQEDLEEMLNSEVWQTCSRCYNVGELLSLRAKSLRPDGVCFDEQNNYVRLLEVISSSPFNFKKADTYYLAYEYFDECTFKSRKTGKMFPYLVLDIYFMGQYVPEVDIFAMWHEYRNTK